MRIVLVAVFLLVIEIFVVGSMLNEGYVRSTIIEEQAAIVDVLGLGTAMQVKEKADRFYRSTFMTSGLRDATYDLFVPTRAELGRSQSIEDLGSSGFGWARDRLDVFWTSVYQTTVRLSVMSLWAPFLAIALLPASIDGLLMRAKKRYTMGYASPFMQRVSSIAIIAVLYVSLLAIFAPLALPPLFVPILGALVAISSGLLLANVQRHL